MTKCLLLLYYNMDGIAYIVLLDKNVWDYIPVTIGYTTQEPKKYLTELCNRYNYDYKNAFYIKKIKCKYPRMMEAFLLAYFDNYRDNNKELFYIPAPIFNKIRFTDFKKHFRENINDYI